MCCGLRNALHEQSKRCNMRLISIEGNESEWEKYIFMF